MFDHHKDATDDQAADDHRTPREAESDDQDGERATRHVIVVDSLDESMQAQLSPSHMLDSTAIVGLLAEYSDVLPP